MNNITLEQIYYILDKHIALAEAYTEIKGLAFIIKACRLRPKQLFNPSRKPKIQLYRWWVDEFGNSFKLIKKKIKIIYGDRSLEQSGCIYTDIYQGLSLEKIAKMSKLVSIMTGTEEDLSSNCIFLTFLGIDNYLRCYVYLYDGWQQISPLCLGLKNLKILYANKDIKYFKTGNKKQIPLPCLSERQWLSFLPANQDFLEDIKKHQPSLCEILNKGK